MKLCWLIFRKSKLEAIFSCWSTMKHTGNKSWNVGSSYVKPNKGRGGLYLCGHVCFLTPNFQKTNRKKWWRRKKTAGCWLMEQQRVAREEMVDKRLHSNSSSSSLIDRRPVGVPLRLSSDAQEGGLPPPPWRLWASRNLISEKIEYVLHVNPSTATNTHNHHSWQEREEIFTER